jgi:hypothetical protein
MNQWGYPDEDYTLREGRNWPNNRSSGRAVNELPDPLPVAVGAMMWLRATQLWR